MFITTSQLGQARRAALVCVLLAITACTAGPSNEDFAKLAQSGVSFTTQIPKVYDHVLTQNIDAKSTEQLKDRKDLKKRLDDGKIDANTYKSLLIAAVKNVRSSNKTLKERQALFQELAEHAGAIQKYFVALNALAQGAQSESAGKSAESAATALSSFIPRIATETINGQSVTNIVGGVTNLVVSELTNAKLRENLEKYGDTVLTAFAIQRQALEDLNKDALKTLAADRSEQVLAKYANPDKAELGESWIVERRNALLVKAQVNPVTSAINASIALEESLKALAKKDASALDQLEKAIEVTDTVLKILGRP